jgi:hypothetical protein
MLDGTSMEGTPLSVNPDADAWRPKKEMKSAGTT